MNSRCSSVGQIGNLRGDCQPPRGPIDNRPAGSQPAPQRTARWLLCFFALLTAARAQAPAADSGQEILAGSGTLTSGIAVQYKTLAVGPGSLADSIGGGFRIDGDILLRLLIDKTGRVYLGYQLGIAVGASTGAYLVSIKPLTGIEDLLRSFAPDAVLRPAPGPNVPSRNRFTKATPSPWT